jgi:hypothetical protein
MLSSLLAPFRGTALHYAIAYLDAVMLGAARDMLDRQVHVGCALRRLPEPERDALRK